MGDSESCRPGRAAGIVEPALRVLRGLRGEMVPKPVMTAGSVHHEAREEHEGSSVDSVAFEFFQAVEAWENARRVGRAAISAAALGNPFPPSLAAALQKKSVHTGHDNVEITRSECVPVGV